MANVNIRRQIVDDGDWLRQAFMIPHKIVAVQGRTGTLRGRGTSSDEDAAMRTRFFTNARIKFSTTTPGGNLVLNPHPQFTKYTDPRIRGIGVGEFSLGRWYSDVIDDNKRYVTFCVGTAQYNSLSNFWTGFYNAEAALMARTGRTSSVFYKAGRAAGFIVGLFSPWLVALSIGSFAFRYLMGKTQTKYYFFKAGMPVFLNAATSVANELAVKTGLISPVIQRDSKTLIDNRNVLSANNLREINSMLPDIIDSYDPETRNGNGINLYAVMSKNARMADRAYKVVNDFYSSRSDVGSMADDAQELMLELREEMAIVNDPARPFHKYLEEWAASGPGRSGDMGAVETLAGMEGANPDGPKQVDTLVDYVAGASKDEKDDDSWLDFYRSELNDGAGYFSMRVDTVGPVSESTMTSTGESEVQSKFNQMSGSARGTRFNLADGNVAGGGLIGEAIGAAMTAAKDVVVGLADGLGFGGAAALGGNAFVDIPKMVTGSQTNLTTMSYQIKLRTPYGNRWSRFVNLWIPFSLLFTMSMPLSTGPASYTGPFYVQCYDRGRAQTRLGVVTNFSVSRGQGNMGWNRIGEPMGIDITIEVTELSSIMHIPISSGFRPLDIKAAFDNESLYQDYMSVLASMSLREQVYVGERLKLMMTKYMKNLDTWASVPHAMNWAGDLGLSRIISIAMPGLVNR